MPEARLGRALVNLTDALVSGYEVLDFLYLLCDRCSDVLIADGVGVMLADDHGALVLSATSTEEARVLELFALQERGQGPCRYAFETGRYIVEADLTAAIGRWTAFSSKALDAGIGSVCAFPLRLRDDRVGVLSALRCGGRPFDERDIDVAKALADVATIGVVQELMAREAYRRSKQLQTALDSRVLIEQAKGILAERHDIDVGTAFEAIRRYARSHSRSLHEVCQAIIDGTCAFE